MDLYSLVSEGFTRFRDVWNFSDFWRRGNTYHAYLRFSAVAEQRFASSPIIPELRQFRGQLIEANTAFFQQEQANPTYWADDFGWWGMALLAARDALDASGNADGASLQLALAQAAWKEMLDRGYDGTNAAQPVPHGCANKSSDSASGAKNTVTNANLLLLSVRLYAALSAKEPAAATQYQRMALAQLAWFDAWFHGPQGYLRSFDKQSYGLVQERPIAAPDYLDKDHPNWEPGWVWSGDQGLILAALAELALWPADDARAPGQARGDAGGQALHPAFSRVLLGVRKLLFGARDAVLREAPFDSSFGLDYGGDYVAGRGILMRYLSEPSVRRAQGAPFAPEAIWATATALRDSRDPRTGQFASDWTPGNNSQFNQAFREIWGQGDIGVSWAPSVSFDGVLQAAGLDVLTAAMAVG